MSDSMWGFDRSILSNRTQKQTSLLLSERVTSVTKDNMQSFQVMCILDQLITSVSYKSSCL